MRIFAIFCLAAIALQPTTMASAQSLPGTGKIIFYRTGAVYGAGVDCVIRYQGREVVDLDRGNHAEWEVPAGQYYLSTKTNNLDVTVEPGQTRYVRCNIKIGIIGGRPDLEKSDAQSYAEHSASYRRAPIMFGAQPPEPR